jgi:hypothetical protein
MHLAHVSFGIQFYCEDESRIVVRKDRNQNYRTGDLAKHMPAFSFFKVKKNKKKAIPVTGRGGL